VVKIGGFRKMDIRKSLRFKDLRRKQKNLKKGGEWGGSGMGNHDRFRRCLGHIEQEGILGSRML
jgi:hypothetical protein